MIRFLSVLTSFMKTKKILNELHVPQVAGMVKLAMKNAICVNGRGNCRPNNLLLGMTLSMLDHVFMFVGASF